MKKATTGRRLIIADIHGCKKTFVKLLKKINFSVHDELFILGDIINRGKDSSGVLNYIIKLKKTGYNILALRGNHEQMLLDIIENEPSRLHEYLIYQKSEDLLNDKGKIKNKYLNFLKDLPYYFELDKFILVHAALDLSADNIFEDKNFMLFSRYQRGNTSQLEGKQMIHGHSVTDIKIIRSSVSEKNSIISIDNGCIYTREKKGFGRLICLNPDTLEVFTKSNCENPKSSSQ